ASIKDALAATQPEMRGVLFGDRFILQGMAAKRGEEGLVLELFWESKLAQPLVFMNAIHLVDDRGNILAQVDYPQDIARTTISPGTLWKDLVSVPKNKL